MSLPNTISDLWKRGADFLQTDTAIMAGAMSWISDHNLVKAVSDAGGFGVIACSAMTPTILEQEIIKTKDLVKGKSYGVNLIMLHPQLDELIDVCLKHSVQYIIFAGGMPNKRNISKVKEGGAKVIAFAPALSLAKRMVKLGVDALVIEGNEAGGHIGPVSTLVLAQEILPYIKEVPIFVAGGIGTGDAIVNFLQMGASGCQIGTLFACAKESIAHPKFKSAMFNANSRDAQVSLQLSPEIPVIPVRSIKNAATEEFADVQNKALSDFKAGLVSKQGATLMVEKFWAGALRRAVIDGDVESGSLMAGQVVGVVKEELTIKQIIDNLIHQCNTRISDV